MKRTHRIAILAASALGLSLPGAALAKPAEDAVAARCAALSKVRLANTTIESAMLVPAKADETTLAGDVPGYPAFCRVVARVRSEPGSDIGVELWLPAQGWAGVFHGNGSGGFDDDYVVTTAGCFGEGKAGGRMCISRSLDSIKPFEPLPAALRLFRLLPRYIPADEVFGPGNHRRLPFVLP